MKDKWIIFFIILNMAIPIISVEAVTPWVIGAASSYGAIRVSQKHYLKTGGKFGRAVLISLLAWGCYYLFYLFVRPLGVSGGFLPFIK